jgi:chlorite dismutase
MMRLRRSAWRSLTEPERVSLLQEAEGALDSMQGEGSALFSMYGHKGDILFIHFRETFEELNSAQQELARLRLSELLEPMTSYVSVVELGLYESSVKLYRQLTEEGVQPHSEQWNKAVEEMMDRQRQAMHPRLFPKIPDTRFVCFYPMDRRRGEDKNWYVLPIEERQRQMDEHGTVGRRYAGKVQQIITGSIGFDDWEWGVDLFGNDPIVFKKLIYEMRFDEVSGVYSNFGQFYLGLRCPAAQIGRLLDGHSPVPNGAHSKQK